MSKILLNPLFDNKESNGTNFFKLKAVWGKVSSMSSKAISKNGNENDPVQGFKP